MGERGRGEREKRMKESGARCSTVFDQTVCPLCCALLDLCGCDINSSARRAGREQASKTKTHRGAAAATAAAAPAACQCNCWGTDWCTAQRSPRTPGTSQEEI